MVLFINLWEEYHRRDTVFFLLHLMWWHMILIYSITDALHLNHLIEVMFARLLYHVVDIVPIEINMYSVGGYIYTLYISYS